MPAVHRRGRRLASAIWAVALVVVLVACQVKVQVDTRVKADGSGVVTVAVGLDREALAKVGDLKSQLRVEDLKAAGWTVTGPSREADGFSWVRASKPFADPAQATAVINEVNGPEGALRGWKVAHSSSAWSSSWTVTGTIDLRRGAATLSDAQLDQALGADGYAAAIRDLSAGHPVSKSVDVKVSVEVPGASKVYAPSLADRHPTPVHVSSTHFNGLFGAGVVVLAVALLAGVLLLLRSRYTRHHAAR